MRSHPKNQRPIRVGLISLGCAKNLVDGEIMLGSLASAGIEITNQSEAADAIIVNTCSFIDSAQEESVDTILESDQLRKVRNPSQALIVSGCLPQRFRDELPKLMPEVDAFMGVDQVARVAEIVKGAIQHRQEHSVPQKKEVRPTKGKSKSKIVRRFAEIEKTSSALESEEKKGHEHSSTSISLIASAGDALFDVTRRPIYIPDFGTPRFRLTPRHTAYLKIAEGCNHPCSFCIIPRLRGAHRSRQASDIVHEAWHLIAEGVRELNLISQDTTYYGLDFRPNRSHSISSPEKFNAAALALPDSIPTLCRLLEELNELQGDFWIRLLYTHPAHWTDELIQTIARCKKVARYIDIPLQHIHPAMLERMRRETSREYIIDLLARIRAGIPGIALRTTFIVGFPGETEEYFQELLRFIRETRFERLGVFAYSQEEGTRAGQMTQQVPNHIKKRRRNQAMAEQHKIARSLSGAMVGNQLKVLVEKQASHGELESSNVTSWEHGLIRVDQSDQLALKGVFLVARAEADAPDIDGRVYVRGKLPLGEFSPVRIIGHTDYDLVAEPV